MDNNSRTYNSTRNMILGFASKFLAIILTFVGRAIFVRILAVEYLGINGLFADVLMMLSLADLGFGTAMAFSFYKPLAERNHTKITALMNFYKQLYLYIAIIVLVVGICFIPFLDHIVNVDNPIPNLELYYLIMLVNTAVSYLFVYKASIVIADQKGYQVSKIEMWTNAAKLILQTVVLVLTHSYLYYIMVTIVTTIANNLLISRIANKLYPYIKEKAVLSATEKKEIFHNMKGVFIYKFSTVLLTGTNNIFISILVGTVSVGLFANYNTITANLSSIIFIVFSSLTPSIGNLVVKEGVDQRYKIFKSMEMVSFWLGGICVVCTYFLVQDFIAWWVGSNYMLGHVELFFIMLNFYLGIVLQPLWSFREATGLYMRTKYIMLVTALLNMVLALGFGYYYGLAGIFAANFIAKLSTYFWYEPRILFKEFFGRGAKEYFLGHVFNFVITFAIIVAMSWLLPNFVEHVFINWVLKALVCIIVVNLAYFIRYRKTQEFDNVFSKVKGIIKVRNKKVYTPEQ